MADVSGESELRRLRGALGIRVETAPEFAGALERALEDDGPALVEIHSDAQLV